MGLEASLTGFKAPNYVCRQQAFRVYSCSIAANTHMFKFVRNAVVKNGFAQGTNLALAGREAAE